jgi:hypothetical protein
LIYNIIPFRIASFVKKYEKSLKYILIELPGSMVQKFLTRMTQVNQIKLFLKSLYPIVCEKKLIRFGPKSDDIDGI